VTRNFAVWEWLKERLMARASEHIRHYRNWRVFYSQIHL
jgi:hypothetical protein